MKTEITCVICYERAKARRIFSKPKGWIKYRAPDGNVVYFSSQECLKKFVFPVTLKELEVKRRWKRLKTAFVTLLAITIVWMAMLYLLSLYPSAQHLLALNLFIASGIITFAWLVTARSYRKLRKRRKEVKARNE